MRQTDTHTSHNRQSDVMLVTDGGDTVETAMAGGSLINMKGVETAADWRHHVRNTLENTCKQPAT